MALEGAEFASLFPAPFMSYRWPDSEPPIRHVDLVGDMSCTG